MEDPIPDSQDHVSQEEITEENDEQQYPEEDDQEWNLNPAPNEVFNHDFNRGNFAYRGQRIPHFRRGRPPFFRPQYDEFGGPRMNGFPRGPRPFPPRPFHQTYDQEMPPHEGMEEGDEEEHGEEEFEGPPPPMFRGPPMYPMWRGPGGPPQRMFPPRFDGQNGHFPMQGHPRAMGPPGGFSQPPPRMLDPSALPPPPFRGGLPSMHHPPFGPPPGMPPPMGHPGMPRIPLGHPPNQDIWVENVSADGKPYYYSMQTRETRWEKPEGVKVIKQTELTANPAVTTIPPSNKTSINLEPNPFSNNNEPPKPPEVQAWAEYKTPEGTPYYHNSSTSTTVWEKPKVLVDWEVFISTINGKPLPVAAKPLLAKPPRPIGSFNPVSLTPNPPGVIPPMMAGLGNQNSQPPPHPNEEHVKQQPPKEQPPQQKPKEDSSRPVSSTPVSGTPWCVVWTGDKRVFFFNPSQRLSVWDRPSELKGREDVDKMVEKYPDPSDEPISKKSKLDDDSVPVNDSQIPMDGDNQPKLAQDTSMTQDPNSVKREILKEAVEKAKIDQSNLPIEERIQQFKEMLAEKQVSAFSTWQKELHKVVFDTRYLLLNSKERKQVFEVYMKERAEEERKEMKNKIKKAREDFRELLKQAEVTSKTSFSDFVAKWNKDDRYRQVEKNRDRESLFQEFTDELRIKEREQRSKEKNRTRQEFFEMLRENAVKKDDIWLDIKKGMSKDPRYKAVDSSSRREDLFHEFISKNESSNQNRSKKHSSDESRRERDRKEREQASLREREKEVKETLSNSLRERDKERDQHIKIEAEDNFKELLGTTIKDPSLDFKEAKKLLKKSSKYDSISDHLEKETKEKIFAEHQANLLKKARESFLKMLDSNKEIKLATPWKNAKKIIRNDARYEKLAKTTVKPESEFVKYIAEKLTQAKRDFKELLQNTPSISFKLRKVNPDDFAKEFDSIFEGVKEDKRYLALNELDDVKLELLKEHLDWLETNQSAKHHALEVS